MDKRKAMMQFRPFFGFVVFRPYMGGPNKAQTNMQTKARQDKTRQDKTRQDKTRQDKTRQDKTRQDKTKKVIKNKRHNTTH